MFRKGQGEPADMAAWLSIIIIGRNESANLPLLFASLPAGDGIEWIYVDSCSGDNSIELAGRAGAAVYLVEADSVYGAGTGRYIGTQEAQGRWLLYLDGDMVLKKEFVDFMKRLKPDVEGNEPILPPGTAAFCGRTLNRYFDNNGRMVAGRDYAVLVKKEMGDPQLWGKEARYHGGAVLYRREAVLKAGNWNPAVYQLEEIDLFSRIRAGGGLLRAVDLPMVEHNTPFLSLAERLRLNFMAQFRGKKLYGLGQVITARAKEGGLVAFICTYPQPFIVLGGLLASIPLLFFCPAAALALNLALALWFGITKKWYYYLVYLGNLLQMLRGLGRYRRFEPRYRKVK